MDKNELKEELLKHEKEIYDLILSENKKIDQKIDINLNDIFNNIVIENVYKDNNNYTVIFNGNPEITLYLAIKAILLNKNIIYLIESEYFKEVNEYLVSIFRNIIKSRNMGIIIKIYYNCKEEQILKSAKLCDEMIYIGNKANYKELNEKCENKVRYNGYNCLYVYYESSDLTYSLLSEIYECCMDRNIIMEKFAENIDDDIYVMNLETGNFALAILTDNSLKISKLNNNINAKYKYINENPFKLNKYHFECDI